MKKTGSMLWSAFESILKFIVFRVLHIGLPRDSWDKFIQFIKFAMVGFSNVIVSYGVYLISFFLFRAAGVLPDTNYLVAQLIGYMLSIFWAFYWNRKYVFAEGQNVVPWFRALVKSFMAYSFTGVFLNSAMSFFWVEIVGISKIIAPVINLVINVPVNYILNKFWAFGGKH